MFKSLIATCLLTFSCSGAPLQEVQEELPRVTAPMLANNDFYSSRLLGAYCFNENCDYESLMSSLGVFDASYEFTFEIGDVYALSTSGSYYGNIHVVNELSVSFYSERDFCEVEFVYTLADDSSYVRTFASDDTFETSNVKYLYFYFVNPLFIEDTDFVYVLNTFLTTRGNTYNQVYTGWYTMYANVGQNFSSVSVLGSFMNNNGLYNRLNIRNVDSFVSIALANYGGGDSFTMYETHSGWYTSELSIYYTGVMIPSLSKDILDDYGVFAYIQPIHNYTFGELIFNIMDAPIYFLSQLFSFELFGIEFYVAFMSIVTLILICFVVKKIV